jgi:hypothetical protein
VGIFRWARVDGEFEEACSACGALSLRTWPALVDWRDLPSVQAQRLSVDGDPCPACGHLRALQFPVLQLRPGDGPGLLVGVPEASPADRDKIVLAEILSAAAEFDLDGAAACCTVRLDWWGRVYNRPLGPVLASARQPDLPIAAEDAAAWRAASADAIAVPDIASGVKELLAAPDEPTMAQVLQEHPELAGPRWRLTAELFLLAAARHEDPDATEAAEQRLARLRYAELAGAGTPPPMVAFTGDAGDPLALAAAAEDPAFPASMRVALRLTHTQVMRASAGTADDETLLGSARAAVAAAAALLDEGSDMAIAAQMNLAVILQERPGDEAAAEALAIFEAAAPLAAASCSRQLPDLAMNLATVAAELPGSRSDQMEDAGELLAAAAHIRALLQADPARETIALLADQAAVLRGRASGNRRENLTEAVDLLRRAIGSPARAALSAPEGVLLLSNLANALTDLRDRAPDMASAEDVAEAARAVASAARGLGDRHPVGILALSNAGASLANVYSAGRDGDSDPSLRAEAVEVLAEACARAAAAFPPGHPETLRAMLHLAAARGAAGADSPDELTESEALLTRVAVEGAARPDFVFAARSNLGQLALGQGRYAEAAAEFGAAAEARRALVARARTPITKLGEVVRTADAAGRHALALAMAGRQAGAVDVLEANRAVLRAGGWSDEPTPSPPPGVVTVHASTCTFGTAVIVRGAVGQPVAIVDPLAERQLAPLVSALLRAEAAEARQQAFDHLAAVLGPAIVEPVDGVISLMSEQPSVIEVIAGGPLASCPLHCVPTGDGSTWTDRWTVRHRISAARPATPWTAPAGDAAGVFDPDGDLPYAGAEREALRRWRGAVREPPRDVDRIPWMTRVAATAGVLHLACHASLDPEDPMRSWFSLGAGQRITVGDLQDLRTDRSSLVVAPACQSGAASPDAPDELLGVGHALLHAGARAVVAAAWDADDAATALTIAAMYERVAAGASISDALAGAQRRVAAITAQELTALAEARIEGADRAQWLPYDLAIELDALLADPAVGPHDTPFGHPALWGALSVLEA